MIHVRAMAHMISPFDLPRADSAAGVHLAHLLDTGTRYTVLPEAILEELKGLGWIWAQRPCAFAPGYEWAWLPAPAAIDKRFPGFSAFLQGDWRCLPLRSFIDDAIQDDVSLRRVR